MSEAFVKKNLRLIQDFDNYFFRNKRARMKVPNGATIVMTVKGDEKFNCVSKEIAKKGSGQRTKFVEARKEGDRWSIRPLTDL